MGTNYDFLINEVYLSGNKYQVVILVFCVAAFLTFGLKMLFLRLANTSTNIVFIVFSILISLIAMKYYGERTNYSTELIEGRGWFVPKIITFNTSVFYSKNFYLGIIIGLTILNFILGIWMIKKRKKY